MFKIRNRKKLFKSLLYFFGVINGVCLLANSTELKSGKREADKLFRFNVDNLTTITAPLLIRYDPSIVGKMHDLQKDYGLEIHNRWVEKVKDMTKTLTEERNKENTYIS